MPPDSAGRRLATIIAGSRTLAEHHTWRALAACPWTHEITEVVSGGARGPDTHGALWASAKNLPVRYFYADWTQHGKAAGRIRNLAMARYADAAIIVWDGRSRGSKHMLETAEQSKLKVFVYRTDEEKP